MQVMKSSLCVIYNNDAIGLHGELTVYVEKRLRLEGVPWGEARTIFEKKKLRTNLVPVKKQECKYRT